LKRFCPLGNQQKDVKVRMIGEKFSEHFSWTLEIVLRSEKSKEFVVLPKLDW
jgi:hypothetical protein